MRNVLCLSFPASALLIVLGEPLVSVLQRGEWTADSTSAVAWALGFYAIGIAGFALLEVLSRAFYALEDTRTPAIAGALAMLSNIALNLIFIRIIGDTRQSGSRRLRRAGARQCRHHHRRSAGALVADPPPPVALSVRRPGIHDRDVLTSAGGSLTALAPDGDSFSGF